MTILPDPDMAVARISDLYRHNLAQLGRDDVVVANMGGAGQSLIGNILWELGLNYVDGYTEILQADGTAIAAREHTDYRQHLASLDKKDNAGDVQPAVLWPRFVKSHHPPVVFSGATFGAVWVLVRDPRDTVYAGYRWRASFGEEAWDQVPDTFAEFLRGRGDFSDSPVDDWVAFYAAWSEVAGAHRNAEVLRFEDLKQRPVEIVSAALQRIGVDRSRADVERAVEASSFAKMREHEDRVSGAGQPRMIRAGKIDGWTEWMTPELAGFFTGDDLREVGERYGYHLETPS
jgi:hypothetical protein